MFYLEENNTINVLNTMEKTGSSPIIHCCCSRCTRSRPTSRNLDTFPHILHHTAADICHFTSHHVIKWTIFQCTEVYQELSSVYYDWWTFKRTSSAVRTSRHYARLWCRYWRIWDIESSATVSLVGLGLLNGTLSEVGPVHSGSS